MLAIIQDEDDDEAVFVNQNDVLEEYNIDEEGMHLLVFCWFLPSCTKLH